MTDSSTSARSGGAGLLEILTAIQGGITAVNALTAGLKLIFPST